MAVVVGICHGDKLTGLTSVAKVHNRFDGMTAMTTTQDNHDYDNEFHARHIGMPRARESLSCADFLGKMYWNIGLAD
jgi:hypothetical protein